MKHLRSQAEKLREFGHGLFQRSGEAASRASQAESSTSSRTSEYAKLNLPRGRWEGRAQNQSGPSQYGNQPPPALPQPSNSERWGSFAMRGLAGLTSGGAMLLLYTHRNDYANTINGIATMSWGKIRETSASMAGLLPQLPSVPFSSPTSTLADAAAKAAPAIVHITANFQSEGPACWADKTCGSGFITDPKGLIVTNAHVVDNAASRQQMAEGKTRDKPLLVALQDGRSYEAKVVGIDRQTDLALLQISPPNPLPSVRLGKSAKMRVGEWVLALGSPLTLQNSVTAGIVSCTGRKAEELGLQNCAANYIQTDAAINIGNSGGPLVNMNGEVIGVSCMRAISNGVSFAIPIDSALGILKEMELGNGKIVRPYVGIKMLELNSEIAQHMHQKNSKVPVLRNGILVPFVAKGSPADKAGLKAGDVITGFGTDEDPITIAALMRAFGSSIGKQMKVSVVRENKLISVNVIPCAVSQEGF